jgi:hypothetical protein
MFLFLVVILIGTGLLPALKWFAWGIKSGRCSTRYLLQMLSIFIEHVFFAVKYSSKPQIGYLARKNIKRVEVPPRLLKVKLKMEHLVKRLMLMVTRN